MPSMARFGYLNAVASGTINSAGSEGLPATNLQNPIGDGSLAWRTVAGVTTGAGGAWVQIDAGVSTVFDCVGIFRTNLTSAATWQIRTYTSNTYATLLVDSGVISCNVQSGYGQAIYLPASPPTARYFRIDINDSTNPDGYISIPLMYAGSLWRPNVGYSQNSALNTIGGNATTTTKYGQSYVNQYFTQRVWSVSFQGMSDAEWQTSLALDIKGKSGANILFIPNTSDTASKINTASVYGLLATTQTAGYGSMSKDTRPFAGTITERL